MDGFFFRQFPEPPGNLGVLALKGIGKLFRKRPLACSMLMAKARTSLGESSLILRVTFFSFRPLEQNLATLY